MESTWVAEEVIFYSYYYYKEMADEKPGATLDSEKEPVA